MEIAATRGTISVSMVVCLSDLRPLHLYDEQDIARLDRSVSIDGNSQFDGLTARRHRQIAREISARIGSQGSGAARTGLRLCGTVRKNGYQKDEKPKAFPFLIGIHG